MEEIEHPQQYIYLEEDVAKGVRSQEEQKIATPDIVVDSVSGVENSIRSEVRQAEGTDYGCTEEGENEQDLEDPSAEIMRMQETTT